MSVWVLEKKNWGWRKQLGKKLGKKLGFVEETRKFERVICSLNLAMIMHVYSLNLALDDTLRTKWVCLIVCVQVGLALTASE